MFSGRVFVTCRKSLHHGLKRILSGTFALAVVFSIGTPYLGAQNRAQAATSKKTKAAIAAAPILVTPLLTCWESLDATNAKAYFGYDNPGSATITIAKGPFNTFSPAPEDRDQPESFQSGKHANVFTTIFDKSSSLVWTLNGLTAVANPGDLTRLCPDTTPPAITEVTPVPTFTSSSTPSYTFSSTEAGTIQYAGGACSSATTVAGSGNTTITFNPLTEGTYSNCTIKVLDAAGNLSNTLTITPFTVDLTKPVLKEESGFANYAYSFNSTEAGSIIYGGACISVTTIAISGSNPVTFNALADGTYSDCTIVVSDAAGNVSEPLSVGAFEIDINGPVVSIGNGNGNNNTGPIHEKSYSGVISVYATIQDPHLSAYYFRVVKDGDSYAPSCFDDVTGEGNQGYGKCGYAFNQAVVSPANVINGVINGELDTAQLGGDGVYWLVLGADDTSEHRTAEDPANDVRIKIIVDNTAPSSPLPILPVNGSLLGAKPYTYVWSPVLDAEEYQLEVCATNPANSDEICPSIVSSVSVTVPFYSQVVPVDGHFWWRVRAKDSAGNWGAYGIAFELTVDAIAPQADDMPETVVREGASTSEIRIKAYDVHQTFLTLQVQYSSPEGVIELPWTTFVTGFPGEFTEDGGIVFAPILLNTQFYGEGLYEYRYYLTDEAENVSNSGDATYAFDTVNAYYGNFNFVNVTPIVSASISSPAQIFPFVDVDFTGSFQDPSFIPGIHSANSDSLTVDLSIPADDAPWTVTVDYGDGTEVSLGVVWEPGDIQIPPHSYGKVGTYDLKLSVAESFPYINPETGEVEGNGEGTIGVKVLAVNVSSYPVVTINRESLNRYIVGDVKYLCSTQLNAVKIGVESWNALDSVQGRYTADNSVGVWMDLKGEITVSGTSAQMIVTNLGERPAGQGQLEVRVLDENGKVLSNRDTTTFLVTVDPLNPACGGITRPVTVSPICVDDSAKTRKWEVYNPNTFSAEYSVSVNNTLPAKSALIDANTKTFFATLLQGDSDMVALSSFGQTVTTAKNDVQCASRNVSVSGPLLNPAVTAAVDPVQAPSILDEGISTYRNPELVQTYDPVTTPTSVLGASVKVERNENIFDVDATQDSTVELTTGEGVCNQFHSLKFKALKAIRGKVFIYDLGKSDTKRLPYANTNLTFGVCHIVLDGIDKSSLADIVLVSKYSDKWLNTDRLRDSDLVLFVSKDKENPLTTKVRLNKVATIQSNDIRYTTVESNLDDLPIVFAIAPRNDKVLIMGLTPFWLATMSLLVISSAGLIGLVWKKKKGL